MVLFVRLGRQIDVFPSVDYPRHREPGCLKGGRGKFRHAVRYSSEPADLAHPVKRGRFSFHHDLFGCPVLLAHCDLAIEDEHARLGFPGGDHKFCSQVGDFALGRFHDKADALGRDMQFHITPVKEDAS